MIVFMGVAGTGKSTQGRRIADTLGLPWLSTGEFLRMLVAGDRRKDMVSGKLLDDKEIITLVRKVFSVVDTDHEFVLDGFPRTVAQADWLISQVKHGQLHMTGVIHLTASKNGVEKRLLLRGRQDDTKEAIDERFREYEEEAVPIIEDFRRAGIPVFDIDAEQSVDDVYQAILKALNVSHHA